MTLSSIWKNKQACAALKYTVSAISLAGALSVAAFSAEPAAPQAIEIEAQSLQSAFLELSRQTGISVYAAHNLVKGKAAPTVQGVMSAEEALSRLLAASNLAFAVQADGTYVVTEQTAGDVGAAGEASENSFVLEEIIVTATKKATSLQDTAMAITNIGMNDMGRRNLVGVEDYLNSVPGVTLTSRSVGENNITIRGLGNIGGGDPAVARYMGEVPISSVRNGERSSDIKLVDMERVEMLRGPQGTLYGANALTGIIRNIPAAPDLTDFAGKIEAGYSKTARGGDDNTKLTAMLNIPLIDDELALRMVAYRFNNGGYVDNIGPEDPVTVAKTERDGGELRYHANEGGVNTKGIRATALWEPNEDLSVSFMYLWQREYQSGEALEDIGFAPYTMARYSVGHYSDDGWSFFEDQVSLANLSIDYDLGWASLFSSTSWSEGGFNMTRGWASATNLTQYGAYQEDPKARKALVQELRLSSQFDGPFQFLSGYFYMDAEDSDNLNYVWMGEPDLYVPANTYGLPMSADGHIFYLFQEDRIKQHALFGELYYDIIDDLTVTFGARYYDYQRVTGSGNAFALGAGRPSETPIVGTTKQNGTVLKASISYKPTEDSMVYAQWGQGFRLGKEVADPNIFVRGNCDVDGDNIADGTNHVLGSDLKSDLTSNYEVGAKASFLDRRLTVNAAAYRIEWTDLPLQIYSPRDMCYDAFPANGGKAVSQGVEIETSLYLTSALRLDLSGSYNNAELARDIPSIGGAKGDKIPRSAAFNGHIALEYQFELADRDAYINGNYYYISEFYGDLAKTLGPIGGYGVLGFSAGMNFGDIDLKVYGTNLLNAKDFMQVYPTYTRRLHPRVVGVELGYNF